MATPVIGQNIYKVVIEGGPQDRQPSKTYGVSRDQKRIFGIVDGRAAALQWVDKLLRTAYNCREIYDNYGIDILRYIGNEKNVVKSVLKTVIERALRQDDRFVKVTSMTVRDGVEADSIIVKAEIVTTDGPISTENTITAI